MKRVKPPLVRVELLENRCLLSATDSLGVNQLLAAHGSAADAPAQFAANSFEVINADKTGPSHVRGQEAAGRVSQPVERESSSPVEQEHAGNDQSDGGGKDRAGTSKADGHSANDQLDRGGDGHDGGQKTGGDDHDGNGQSGGGSVSNGGDSHDGNGHSSGPGQPPVSPGDRPGTTGNTGQGNSDNSNGTGSQPGADQGGPATKPPADNSGSGGQSGTDHGSHSTQDHVATSPAGDHGPQSMVSGQKIAAARGSDNSGLEAAPTVAANGRVFADDATAAEHRVGSLSAGNDAVPIQVAEYPALAIEVLTALPLEVAGSSLLTGPIPGALDLLAGFLPVDQEGLQAAMDRLLARIDDLGGQLIAPAEGMGLSPYLFTAIAAISAYQVAVRLRKPSTRQASFSTDAGASIATSFSHWSGSTQSM